MTRKRPGRRPTGRFPSCHRRLIPLNDAVQRTAERCGASAHEAILLVPSTLDSVERYRSMAPLNDVGRRPTRRFPTCHRRLIPLNDTVQRNCCMIGASAHEAVLLVSSTPDSVERYRSTAPLNDMGRRPTRRSLSCHQRLLPWNDTVPRNCCMVGTSTHEAIPLVPSTPDFR